MTFRKEKDSMGTVKVPSAAYYGPQSQRSINNFTISNIEWHPALLQSITMLKLSCAKANNKLGLLDAKKTNAIVKACEEVIKGKLSDQFPLDIFQAGSGTSTNMNVNEVIANRASELMGRKKGSKAVHPNDDVNKGQSTNNIIPSAIRVASLILLDDSFQQLTILQKELKKKAVSFNNILKSGRTHLQDAVPIRLGQEFNAYATAIEKNINRLKGTKNDLTVLGVGGNAVGTGLNTHPKFRSLIIKFLNKELNYGFQVAKDGIEATQFLTDIAALSSILKLAAIDINKIANDLRLLSSGPKTGLNEINLPPVEPGSSIMPGKINPSIAEAVNMACMQVMGNDTTITIACTAGNLDLNTHMPVIGHNITESLEILGNAAEHLAVKCINGITPNKKQCDWYVDNSMALATALNPYIGYDKASDIVKESLKTGKPIKQLVLEKGYLKKAELDRILDPKKLTSPNLRK